MIKDNVIEIIENDRKKAKSILSVLNKLDSFLKNDNKTGFFNIKFTNQMNNGFDIENDLFKKVLPAFIEAFNNSHSNCKILNCEHEKNGPQSFPDFTISILDTDFEEKFDLKLDSKSFVTPHKKILLDSNGNEICLVKNGNKREIKLLSDVKRKMDIISCGGFNCALSPFLLAEKSKRDQSVSNLKNKLNSFLIITEFDILYNDKFHVISYKPTNVYILPWIACYCISKENGLVVNSGNNIMVQSINKCIEIANDPELIKKRKDEFFEHCIKQLYINNKKLDDIKKANNELCEMIKNI